MAQNFSETTFLAGNNAIFLEQLHAAFTKDPGSVDPSWAQFFSSLGDDAEQVMKEALGASWSPRPETSDESDALQAPPMNANISGAMPRVGLVGQASQETLDSIRALMLNSFLSGAGAFGGESRSFGD